ncbi:MAG: tryptophan synthase subunit alpha [Candidatus Sumerlaeaceae bacterium]|nr:tryptophan synthase subunit alpha [Candidatus Sumerlaeaceae bacterium]
MNRIDKVFAELKERGEAALIPYLTAGFPNLEATLPLLRALVRGGADVIELGVPFSDPVADGPTIQRSSSEALAAGTTFPKILEIVKQFRAESETPIVLFGAYNPFFHYGMEKAARDAATVGVDAFLIPDLPADEGTEAEPAIREAGLYLIYLIAPTTPPDRVKFICSRGSGFLYYISVKGVTGARTSVSLELEKPLAQVHAATKLPVAVGFGIGTPEQAAQVGRLAEGVVVGSALVDLVGKNRDAADRDQKVEEYIRSMKAPLKPLTV